MLKNIKDETIFMILFVMTTFYFSGVMARLILIVSTGACIMASYGINHMLKSINEELFKEEPTQKVNKKKQNEKKDESSKIVGIFGLIIIVFCLLGFAIHSIRAGRDAYSNPSLVFKVPTGRDSYIVFDDFRDSYRWLNQNTPENATVMSWWDYGYQLAAIANRTTIVDNNTWNNSHIARVGNAFAKNEKESYKILKELDVDYVLVIFGGLVGFSGDDLNKFPWMIRIGGTIDETLNEKDYIKNEERPFDVGYNATQAMKDSVMYKLSYYRFGELVTDDRGMTGFDRVRQTEILEKNIQLEHFEEVYTSVHWMVRIYKVKKDNNRIFDIDDLK